MGKKYNLLNQKFDRLFVREKSYITDKKGRKRIVWLCDCDCGNHIAVPTSSLIHGLTKSCGCLHTEQIVKRNKENKKTNKYFLDGKCGIGITSNTDKEFYFDLEDYEKIKNYCWFENNDGYIETNINGKTIKIHRMIMDVTDRNIFVDHINHNTLDNRKSELRICCNQENCFNESIARNNTTGIMGVIWHKRDNIWEAIIGYNNKSIYLGRSKDKDTAIKMRLQAEKKYFGEFAPQKNLFVKYGIEV